MLLAHEMPGVGGQEERHGVDFSSFFANANGATPTELLKRGIYSEIAVCHVPRPPTTAVSRFNPSASAHDSMAVWQVPLKGGAWREASMALLGMALGMSAEQLAKQEEWSAVDATTNVVRSSLERLNTMTEMSTKPTRTTMVPVTQANATVRSSTSAIPVTEVTIEVAPDEKPIEKS